MDTIRTTSISYISAYTGDVICVQTGLTHLFKEKVVASGERLLIFELNSQTNSLPSFITLSEAPPTKCTDFYPRQENQQHHPYSISFSPSPCSVIGWNGVSCGSVQITFRSLTTEPELCVRAPDF